MTLHDYGRENECGWSLEKHYTQADLERAVQNEREACARILDRRATEARAQHKEHLRAMDLSGAKRRLWWAKDCDLIAHEIRARGDQP